MCTTIVVGGRASADGSLMIARSADSSALKAQHFLIHPARQAPSGAIYSCRAQGGVNDFTYPLPERGLSFTTVANWRTHLHGAAGFNELGVGITATESIFTRDDVLAVDPWNKADGISEDDIPDVILPRARGAREACALLGSIIEERGAAEGFGVGFIDAREIWYLETGSGHHWLAQRCPAEACLVSANQGRLREYRPRRQGLMASRGLVSFAVKHGFHDPSRGAFDFSASYIRDDERDRVYNDPRVWSLQRLYKPTLRQPVDCGRDFPVYIEPARPLTAADLRAGLRDHYEGSPHDPYGKGLNGSEPWRPVSVFRTYESHILRVRPGLPPAIGCLLEVAFGMADLSCYMPFYLGLDAVPVHFALGSDEADSQSIYWKFRKLQTLAMTDYPRLAPLVRRAFAAQEKRVDAERARFERRYVTLARKDEAAARDSLRDFCWGVFADTEALVERLTNQLFTRRTADIEKENFFGNRKLKD